MFDMTKEVIAAISAAIGVLATGVPFIIGFWRKAKRFVKEHNWNKLMEFLPGLVIEAEKFLNYTGSEKKEYVKSRLAVYSVQNKIAFDCEKFDSTIDDIVKLTKQVNKRDKDKTEAGTQNVLPLISNN